MPYRNPRRGIHAPHTQNARLVRLDEIGAIDLLNAGALSIIDYQLADTRFVEYLEFFARDGGQIYLRHLTPNFMPPASEWAERIKNAQLQFPFIYGHIPANEPNLEFPNLDWSAFNQWCIDLWYNVDYHRQQGVELNLFYPPLAQDMSDDMNHAFAYPLLEGSIRQFIENGDGFSWHSYWNSFDLSRNIEDELPNWLRDMLPHVDTLIHETGRKVDDPGGVDNFFISELTARYGSANSGDAGSSVAKAITPWLLSSRDEAFQHQAFIDETGGRRQILYDWAWWGP